MKLSKRDFVKGAAASVVVVAAASKAGRPGGAASASETDLPGERFDVVVYNDWFSQARAFASQQAEQGVRILPVAGDAGHLWYRTLRALINDGHRRIAGVTTHLSLTSRRARGDDEAAIRRQIIKRGLLIFLFGFLVNGFPFFTWGDVTGIAHPTFLERVVDRLYHWRIMGVLQRIGLAYLCAALLAQGKSVKRQVATIAVLLFGYWFAMTLLQHTCRAPAQKHGLLGVLDSAVEAQPSAASWLEYSHHLLQRPRPISEEL